MELPAVCRTQPVTILLPMSNCSNGCMVNNNNITYELLNFTKFSPDKILDWSKQIFLKSGGNSSIHWLFDSHSSLCSEYQLSCWRGWGCDWVMISLSLSLIKLVVSLQSRSSRCGDVGSDRTQNSASFWGPQPLRTAPRRSRGFNLNIGSVELISSNLSSSLRRRNAHSNDDSVIQSMTNAVISISHSYLKASIFHHSINYAACFISKWFTMQCIVSHSKIILQKNSIIELFFLIWYHYPKNLLKTQQSDN